MRVTLNSAIRDAQAQLERTEELLATRARELASGRRINALSDDPSASASAILHHAEVARIDSYVRATDSVDARLSIVDSLLTDVIVQITAAQTTAAASRGSSATPSQRDALANQLEGIRDTILADVNTQFRGTYLFSGAAVTTAPYTKSGGVVSGYQGDATAVHVDLDRNSSVQVSMNGDELLRGTDANDLFVEFDALIAAVRAGDAAGIDAGMAALDRALDRANGVQSRVGNSLRTVGEQRLRLGHRRTQSLIQVSRHEDANLAETITEMQKAEVAYQAAVAAIAQRLPLSLFDFIR